MGRAQSEISIIMNTLSSIFTALNNPGLGLILKPSRSTSTWAAIARNMHRLLILRGLITETDRFPEDPWTLFLREFGASEPEPDTQLADEQEPDSILLTSPRCARSRQRLESSQHVRFRLPSPRQRERYQWS
ncbi:hypothetical protein PHISP_05097 [Aspergillus sp. HF37]|nr:hypothetical protein PHISP_05097 [Aspergillus sp. HF37]